MRALTNLPSLIFKDGATLLILFFGAQLLLSQAGMVASSHPVLNDIVNTAAQSVSNVNLSAYFDSILPNAASGIQPVNLAQ